MKLYEDPSSSDKHNFQYAQGSAVSHTDESHKTKVQVIWVAPSDSPFSVQFL